MLITLTTDFGLQDGYVGVLKGVLSGIAPNVPLIDITHEIPPHDVRSAAYVLWTALGYFSRASVHLVVVDPGVGTERQALASLTEWGVLVGPDNGIFSYVWAVKPPLRTVRLTHPKYHRPVISTTFHGRDIFAPAAAHLATGVSLVELGPQVEPHDLVRLSPPSLTVRGKHVQGEVIYIDRFGNAVTSIGRLTWGGTLLHLDPIFGQTQSALLRSEQVRVSVGERDIGPIRRTYGEVAPGEPLALVGSEGLLELAVAQQHGAQTLGLRLGDKVEIAL